MPLFMFTLPHWMHLKLSLLLTRYSFTLFVVLKTVPKDEQVTEDYISRQYRQTYRYPPLCCPVECQPHTI
eukprot:c15892_g1_i1 orf=2-208(-)